MRSHRLVARSGSLHRGCLDLGDDSLLRAIHRGDRGIIEPHEHAAQVLAVDLAPNEASQLGSCPGQRGSQHRRNHRQGRERNNTSHAQVGKAWDGLGGG